jgi:hypothetical protein
MKAGLWLRQLRVSRVSRFASIPGDSVREGVYDGIFATPKTEAGRRQIPLSDLTLRYMNEWKQRAGATEPDKLVFSTRTGGSISPNNVRRRAIFPACDVLKNCRVR